MKIRLVQPHPDYPFAWVHVEVSSASRHTSDTSARIDGVLADKRITLLGKWEVNGDDNTDLRAPVLIEDEHTKPKKRK
jgi:hypothetical protein